MWDSAQVPAPLRSLITWVHSSHYLGALSPLGSSEPG